MPDKEDAIYLPVLNAFINEMVRAYKTDSVVAIDKKQETEFQAFNLRGELNKDGAKTKASVFVPRADLPTEIISLRIKPDSKNTAELFLNNGWSFSFRIHNASKIVEPSLKFDIQFLGVPASIITINCSWQ